MGVSLQYPNFSEEHTDVCAHRRGDSEREYAALDVGSSLLFGLHTIPAIDFSLFS